MAATTTPPKLSEVKAWLGIDDDDTQDDAVLQESLDAALAAQALVVVYPVDTADPPAPVWPDDLREAIFLRTQRLAARRNSPEGIVGLTGTGGDFVGARIPAYDADVSHLEGPHQRITVA